MPEEMFKIEPPLPGEEHLCCRLERGKEIKKIAKEDAFSLLSTYALQGGLSFRGVRLIPDFFSFVKPLYLVSTAEGGGCYAAAEVHFANKEFSLCKMDFLAPGPLPWFVQAPFLKFFERGSSWKWLQRCYREEYVLLTAEEKKLFLKSQRSYCLLLDTETPPQTYPLLVLKDRLGSFANLFLQCGTEVLGPYGSLCSYEEQAQQWERDLLKETAFCQKYVGDARYYCPTDKVATSIQFLLECGWKVQDHRGRRVELCQNTYFHAIEKKEKIHLQGHLEYLTCKAPVKEAFLALQKMQSFLPLGEEAVGLLPPLPSLEGEEILTEGVSLPKNRFSLILEEEMESHLSWEGSLQKDLRAFHNRDPFLPSKHFLGHLRPYQQQGLNWMGFLKKCAFSGILADEMGLGKTVQVLAFLSSMPEELHLVIVPKTLLFHWEEQIQTFLPQMPFSLHYGTSRFQEAQNMPKRGILLTSYGMLCRDLPLLASLSFATCILDEAQEIKNAKTQTARAACQLKASLRLCITGTPVENSLQDLWSQFHFLMPGFLGKEEHFREAFPLQKIKKMVQPFILRRHKKQVAPDLPEKIEETIWIEMEEEQRSCYNAFLAKSRHQLLKKESLEGGKPRRIEIFEILLRLRQLCCHPLLLSYEVPSAKLETLLLELETLFLSKRKVLIYSQFTQMLTLIASQLKKKKWPFIRLDGNTKDRQSVVSQFQQDPQLCFFLISLKAGGVGLNLTAADDVFLYDPWWNEAVENQAIDRAHRIGRRGDVIVKRYIVKNSVEEKMMHLKKTKKALVENLFEDSPQLTTEDLLSLLE